MCAAHEHMEKRNLIDLSDFIDAAQSTVSIPTLYTYYLHIYIVEILILFSVSVRGCGSQKNGAETLYICERGMFQRKKKNYC